MLARPRGVRIPPLRGVLCPPRRPQDRTASFAYVVASPIAQRCNFSLVTAQSRLVTQKVHPSCNNLALRSTLSPGCIHSSLGLINLHVHPLPSIPAPEATKCISMLADAD